jgi:hypothetical protein
MRTTTFDMVGMALMAVVVILTSGVMLVWGYLKEARGGREPDSARATTGERNTHRDTPRAVSATEDTRSADERRLAHH